MEVTVSHWFLPTDMCSSMEEFTLHRGRRFLPSLGKLFPAAGSERSGQLLQAQRISYSHGRT